MSAMTKSHIWPPSKPNKSTQQKHSRVRSIRKLARPSIQDAKDHSRVAFHAYCHLHFIYLCMPNVMYHHVVRLDNKGGSDWKELLETASGLPLPPHIYIWRNFIHQIGVVIY
ncbi:hypothetical protein ACOSP7_019572 [Xanthoceras sorbifolium]